MRTSNIERPTSNIEVKTDHSFFTSMFDVRISFLLLLTLQACCPPKPPEHPAYSGPTDPMELVIGDINRNSNRIPSLWTQLNYTATLIDKEKHTTDVVNGDGVLMYTRPISLLLNGDKDVAGQVFQIGSNNEEFWVKIRATASTFNFYWGHYANLGKPGSKQIPIRPDLVVQVLGIGVFGTNFLELPVPVMRFDNAEDAYVFDINELAEDRWETREEIWYDRSTKLPIKVLLYGPNGRVLLRAELSQQTPVQTPGISREQWPMIARHYDLLFTDSGTKISFDFLNIPEIQHLGRRNVLLPNANSFHRDGPDDGDTEIKIDP